MTFAPRGETLVGALERESKTLARGLFASMLQREFDTFARSLASLIDRLHAHLAAIGAQL